MAKPKPVGIGRNAPDFPGEGGAGGDGVTDTGNGPRLEFWQFFGVLRLLKISLHGLKVDMQRLRHPLDILSMEFQRRNVSFDMNRASWSFRRALEGKQCDSLDI